MQVVQLVWVGFTFEGRFPKDEIQLPDDIIQYPNYWCFWIGCLRCNLNCQYCYNKKFLDQDIIQFDSSFISDIRQQFPIDTFVYGIGEPGLFTNEIAKIIQQYPSDQFRHCIKTNGSFISDDLAEDIYAINTDIKGNSAFYDQITQRIGFFEDVLKPHLHWLSEIAIPDKELTYSIWLWRNDDEETRQLVLKYVDQTDARLCLNFIRSHKNFDVGYDLSLDNERVYERICDIYLWFKDYGIEPFVFNFKDFDPNKTSQEFNQEP